MSTSAGDDGEAGQSFARAWGVLAHIVAPTTFIVAIMMYFGAVYTNNVYAKLGVDQSLLGLSVQDYVVRSVPVAVEPLVFILSVVLLVFLAHVWVIRYMPGRHAVATWTIAALIMFGGVATATGIMAMADQAKLPDGLLPICLILGVCALAYSAYLHVMVIPRRALSPTYQLIWRTVFVMLVLALLFWSIAVFAERRGQEDGIEHWGNPGGLPSTVIYAPRRLHLEGPGIVETPLPGPDAMFRYRYTGLRLLIHSNRRYFLLPACWATSPEARAIALPADESLRLEFFMINQEPACS
ncbi:hypothetical protein [Nonomuraea sp. NPDC050643]|uniref:hypothetical protein n=1 Tax=Nonomuraea sp. NPDC050643 TaxID=3155660 RepID=UPI0033D74E80